VATVCFQMLPPVEKISKGNLDRLSLLTKMIPRNDSSSARFYVLELKGVVAQGAQRIAAALAHG
jgi:hypothetical protein